MSATGTVFEVRVGVVVVTREGIARAGVTRDCPALPVLPVGGVAVYADLEDAVGLMRWCVRRFHDQVVSVVACRGRVLPGVREREAEEREHEEAEARGDAVDLARAARAGTL